MNRPRGKPTAKHIRNYWADELNWALKGFDSRSEFMELGLCFACGLLVRSGCERSHIKARAIGGLDVVDNLHLLCLVCHKVSEHIQGVAYWRWFYNRRASDTVSMIALKHGCNSKDAYQVSKVFEGFGGIISRD